MILKTCPDCGQDKRLDAFGNNRAQPDGKAFYCRPCFNLRSAAAYRRKQARLGRTVRERVTAPAGHKWCPDCKQTKPLEEFHRAPRQAGGRASYCRVCKGRRDERRRLERLYGLTPEGLEQLIASQDGLCAVCVERPAQHVDHDHETGFVRGVLCFCCNAALGQMRDDVRILRAAIAYVERHAMRRTVIAPGVYQLLPKWAA